ncbi:MAG: hypothetical protein KDB27_31970 [Planctomycetales bacterium]|nr:hypothetical protein [Planctomycetales bacterium]
MPKTIQRPNRNTATQRVKPSRVNPATAAPFTLDQELEPFGTWVGEPIWVPPKDESKTLATTMVNTLGLLTSKHERWSKVVDEHRVDFTQVREIDLHRASIRLPKGKFYVSVTEQEHFDSITDAVPNCVRTRLAEFLEGPGKQKGVKVYYLKPLCVEIGDELILTTRDDIDQAISQIQDEVFAEFRRQYFQRLPKQVATGTANLALAVPRSIVNHFVQRRQRAIDKYQSHLEFLRRKNAMRAAKHIASIARMDARSTRCLESQENLIEQT